MKINDGYKIVFLGDVIDRGQYSSEIVFIIFLLIYVNNLDDANGNSVIEKPKIYYIRGNHEDIYWSSHTGFKDELEKKCGNCDAEELESKLSRQ
jgi:hypothetical protein